MARWSARRVWWLVVGALVASVLSLVVPVPTVASAVPADEPVSGSAFLEDLAQAAADHSLHGMPDS